MDDLTRIDGIGKATAKRLAHQGIETFAQLAAIEDGEDSPAEQFGVKTAWIAEAGRIAGEQQDTEGKPPRPDHGAEDSAEAPALPADGGAGDPQQDYPRGSSGTAREASSTGGGTTAETSSVGTQSGSPNLSTDTVSESMRVGDAPNAGVPDAPLVPDAASAERAARDAAMTQFQADLAAGVPLEEAAAVLTARSAAIRDEFLATRAVELRRAVVAAETTTRDRQTIAADAVARRATVIVMARREGFRRAGMAHPKAPTPHSAAELGVDRLVALLAEPNLTVELV